MGIGSDSSVNILISWISEPQAWLIANIFPRDYPEKYISQFAGLSVLKIANWLTLDEFGDQKGKDWHIEFRQFISPL